MTASENKSYLPYLNQLVDEYNTYIILLIKNLLMLITLLSLEKLRRILKLLILKFMTESELLSIIIYLAKVILKIGQGNYLSSILFLNIILGRIEFFSGKK